MIIQAGYDILAKDYVSGLYSEDENDDDDDDYDNPLLKPTIVTDVFKKDATQFCRSLPRCIPTTLVFNEIDGN